MQRALRALEMFIKFSLKSPKGRDNSENVGLTWKIILKQMLWKYVVRVWIGLSWLRSRLVPDYCEHGNKHLVP